MALTNKIGTFEFFDLAGTPETLKQQIGLFTRAGVDGVTLVDDGQRGAPFTLRSRVDMESLAAGRAEYVAYCDSIGSDPVDVTWRGVALSAEETKFVVLDVRLVDLRGLAVSSGGLRAGLAWLECDWVLIAVKV